MYRIDVATAAPSLPAPSTLGTEGYWAKGNPATATPATQMDQDWFNALQENLIGILSAAGVAHSKTDYTRLATAIKTLIQAETGNYAPDTGAANAYAATYAPAIAAHTAGLPLRVKVANTNTGASTFNPGPGVKSIVHADGSVLNANELVAGGLYTLIYNDALGAYELASSNIGATSVQGAFKNLKVATLSTTQIQTTADQLVLQDTSGHQILLSNVNVTASTGTTGANGLDVAGALAANTPLSKWVIYNPTTTTTAALLSQSQTSPTMPSGYTFKARVGYAMVSATPALIPTLQYGRRGKYTGAPPTLASTSVVLGSAAVSLVGHVPPTASSAQVSISCYSGGTGYLTASVGASSSSRVAGVNAEPDTETQAVSMLLESMNVYWTVSGTGYSSVTASLTINEWEDNL